ncbi:unnamed protein product [Symbiodinium sp. CCMP2592]|nr:unnamed protein product [Symbiodinium sp. CCMP2592]
MDFGDALAAGSSHRSEQSSESTQEILSQHIYELQLEVNELRLQVQALTTQVQALEESLSRVWVNQTGRFSSRPCTSLELLFRGMSAEAFYPDEGPQVPLSAIPASPISPSAAVFEGTPDQGPLAAFMSSPVEGDDLTEEQLGGLMSREDTQLPPDDDPIADRLEQQLAGFMAYGGSAGDWHAMNSGFILARHSRQAMPWERVTRPRLGPGFMFQEPLLGRFDGLRRAAIPAPAAGPWAWVPKGTYEARRLLAARFAKSDDMLRLTALKKIRLIVLFFPDDSELGRNLVGSAGSLVEESMLTSFAKWIVASKGRPLAPSEGELYAYMLHLRREKAGATAGESFLKAYKFFVHLTGAAQGSRISPRVQGAAKAMSMAKRPLWQAPPLPAEAVRLLEELVHDSEDYARASIAGFILFCLYSSARWSDAARGTDLSIDVAGNGLVLLECSTKHYKTKAKDRKDTVLPLIALGSGLTQPSWGRVWMRKRALAGLPDCAVIMPAMSPGGNFLGRAMTAAEGSLWLREFLHLQGFAGDLEQYSSHSLKATALSWTAKSGTMTYEERLTQGHHCSPKHGMALLYSRDALAEIIVKVAKVVSAVSRGVFSPDLPRAERVARALHGDPADFAHLPETTAEDLPAEEPQDENNSEAGSDITNLGGLEVDLGAPAPEEVRPRLSSTFSGETYMHVLSGVVHKLVNPGIFKCGRKVTANMRLMGPEEAQENVCQQCLMAGLESVPAFTDRAKQIGISEDLLKKLLAKSLDTFGKLAFVCSSKPSSGDDTPLFEALKTLIGSEVPVEQHMVIRRLWYESHAHALVDLESRASRTSDTSPRELPLAERLTRLKRQRGELKGLEMDIHTEPGHGLVDRVQAMLDSAQVLHIAPEKCISRHDEILGEKTEQKISLGADGNIKVTKQASSLRCETTGELKLRRCFLRRALAFDQVGLASFTALESWHNRMFQALLDVPPAGYRYTTVQQLLAADQKLWQVVAQESRGDIVVGVGAPAPLDKHIAAAATNQFVVSCLTHLPKPLEAPAPTWLPNKPGKGLGKKGDKGNKGGGKGKGKQNHSQSGAEAAPTTSLKELLESLPEGCVRATDEGRFICPFYNKGRTSSANIDYPQVTALFDALPHDQCDRSGSGFSFSAGLYSRVQVGLRKACKLFPLSVQAVNKFVAHLLDGAVYTSFAIFSRVQTREHRDKQNSFLPNIVIPLTAFTGGAIKVLEPNREIDLEVSKGPVQFCARQHPHSTCQAHGRRTVLVLFSLKAASHASADDQLCLKRLGFPLPNPRQLSSVEVCKSEPISLGEAKQRLLPFPDEPQTGSDPGALGTPTHESRPPSMVECLACRGPLAAEALLTGWDAIPVGKGPHDPHGSPMLHLDLSEEENVQALLRFDSSAAVDWWHGHLFLKSCARLDRGSSKQPLRSADCIFGCPKLAPRAQDLVHRDNKVCRALVSALQRAHQTGALVSLIGPARSWVWSLLASTVKSTQSKGFIDWFFTLEDQELDTCMFGSPFLTSLKVKATPGAFPQISATCDKSHKHQAWLPSPAGGTFNDASLPHGLCQRLCECATKLVTGSTKPRAAGRCRQLRAAVRAAAANQSHFTPPLIPEFRVVTPLSQVPSNADFKILDKVGSTPGELDEPDKRFRLNGSPPKSSAPRVGAVAGVYHTMEEHLRLASNLCSPADTSERLPDQIRRNIFAMLTEGPVAISKKRLLALQQLNRRVQELADEERTLRESMHPDVESVTRGKAISLFRELLEETAFADMSVIDLLVKGVPLVGQEQDSALFAKRPKPQEISPDQLRAQSALRRDVLQRTRKLVSQEDYAAMRAETDEEVKAGFLSGPYSSESEVSKVLGATNWSLSPRFLLRQGEDAKIRIIDDFKMSAVNRAFGSSSFLELQDTDFAVGLLRFLSRVLQDRSRVRVPLLDGSVLEGNWAPEMLSAPPLLGKTLDLSKAYRQLAIHPDCKEFSVLGFPTPAGGWEYYITRSLPFGAGASVFGFNKVALGVLHIMTVKFMAIATDFYDDYTIYEFKPAASLLDKALMRLLDILGWTFARSGRKFVPFAEKVTSLGVTLGLEEIWQGTLTVENKAGRLERIVQQLKRISQGDEITRSDVASLHGLLNFAGGLILGFELKATSRMLSRALTGPFRGNTTELQHACALALDVLSQCRPKRCPASVKPPIILYTDGAYEKGVGTWGAVIVDGVTGARWTFGGTVCQQLKDLWERQAGNQIICQVEGYALAILIFGLRGFLKGRSVIAFIDNEACRFGFIKRYSPSLSLLRLISLVALLEGSLEALLWFERVPSKSNPADLPSRGAFEEACKRFAVENKGDIALTPTMLDFLCAADYSAHTAQAILTSTRLEADWTCSALQ